MDVRLPDGTVIKNVPDGMSKADLTAKLQNNGYDVSKLQSPQQPYQGGLYGWNRRVGQSIGNVLGGMAQGAANIGTTILDATGISQRPRDERMVAFKDGMRELGIDTESLGYKGGEIGGEVAGTAGVGGAIAKPIMAAAKYAPALAKVGNAFNASGLAKGVGGTTNIAAGGVTGAVGAGMVNPDQSQTGGSIGAGISAVPVAGKGAAKMLAHVLGTTSGVGGDAVKTAFTSGMKGGKQAQSLAENMRGQVPIADVLDEAKSALSAMRTDRGNAYRAGMEKLGKSQSVLPFKPIEDAVVDSFGVKSFKGVSTSPSTKDVQLRIMDEVGKWKSLPKDDYHTAEGFDALKQTIGDIRDSTQFGTPERKVADSVYHAVKNQIVKADKTYAETMKDYEQASGLLSEIEKALSLGNKASADTSMRKLQSLTRNNVNTNFTNRTQLAQKLKEYGADTMMPALTGQALSSWTPRGLQAASATGVGGMAAISNPAMLPLVAGASPRLVGESALAAGKGSAEIAKYADILRKAPMLNKATNESQNSLIASAIRQGLL